MGVCYQNAHEKREYGIVIEKEDFDTACAVDYLSDIALYSFHYVHCLRLQQLVAVVVVTRI